MRGVHLCGRRSQRRTYSLVYNPRVWTRLQALDELMMNRLPAWVEGKVLPGPGGEADMDRSVVAVDAKENYVHRPIPEGDLRDHQGS